jgi:hypothetical protein
MGEEIGIIGKELQPPVFVLTDSINENIYLSPHIETPLSFDVINLSASPQLIDFRVSTENSDLLTIINQPKSVKVPAQSRIHVGSMAVVKANAMVDYKNTGYIKIVAVIDGIAQEREQIIQVVVKNTSSVHEAVDIKIFDGRSEELDLYKYNWNEWDTPVSTGLISEGNGNGNGKAELNETFSIWILPQLPFGPLDTSTWHPTTPVNWKKNPDVTIEEIRQHRYNTGRAILSAQISLNRKPTRDDPVRIPLQTEWLKVQYLEGDCHRNTADNFNYSYYELVIYEDGSARIENK